MPGQEPVTIQRNAVIQHENLLAERTQVQGERDLGSDRVPFGQDM